MSLRFLAVALVYPFIPVAAVAAPVDNVVRLAPHRVVYDLSLVSSRGLRGIENARGRIAYEFSGNACDGYGLKFRQVTVLQTDGGESKLSDLRTANFESGDGRTFRFKNETTTQGSGRVTVDGNAERQGNGPLSVRLKGAKRPTNLPGDTVFPNAQMKDIIAAAREGRTTVALKVFDGSENGRKLYETLAVIGPAVDVSNDVGLEDAARQDGLAKMPRWPVTVSYFDAGRGDRTPAYVLSFDLYDNGVSRALKLDYGDFVLRGDMTRLELLPAATTCQR